MTAPTITSTIPSVHIPNRHSPQALYGTIAVTDQEAGQSEGIAIIGIRAAM